MSVRKVLVSLHLLRSQGEDKTFVKHCLAHEDSGRLGFAFVFVCMGGKNPKTLKLSPRADDAITQGGIGGLGFLVYICEKKSVKV